MKIHSISVQNINSLRGSFTVDFTKPPLRDCGLFAITGPTGAGKTTLLDALTLALFGDVARDAHVDGVMSYGTGECRAEVVFETARGVFKAKWARQRAHGKAEKNLQPVKRELAEWPSGKIIAERIADVDRAVVEMLGLSRDQFLKSVLLAQGDFTAFLKADKNSRAELLEKMTSTDEYRNLSIKAFGKFKSEEEAEERLQLLKGSIQLLPEEIEVAKSSELQESGKEAQECNRLRDERLAEKNWFDLLDNIEKAVAKAEERTQSALKAKLDAKDVFQKWQAHQQVAPFELQMVAVFERQKESDNLKRTIAGGRLDIESLQDKKTNTANAHAVAEKESLKAKSELDSKRPGLQNAIAEKRVQANDQEQLQTLQKERDAKNSEISKHAERMVTLREELAKNDQKKKLNEEWLRQNATDKQLQIVIDECREQLQLLTDLRKDATIHNNEIKRQNEKRDAASRRIQSSDAVLEECSKESARLHEEEKKLTDILSQWKLFVAKSKVLVASDLVALDSKINIARELVASKDFFIRHHEALVEGKACPLCGSESHPGIGQNVDELKDQLKVLQGELKSLQKLQEQQLVERGVALRLEDQLAEISPANELLQSLELNQVDDVLRQVKMLKELPLKFESLSGREQMQTAEKRSASAEFDVAVSEISRNQIELDGLTLQGREILDFFQNQATITGKYAQGKEIEFINQIETRLANYLEQEKQSDILAVRIESLQMQVGSEELGKVRLQQEFENQQASIESLNKRIDERTKIVRKSLESPFTAPETFLQHLEKQEAASSKALNESVAALNNINSELSALQTLQTNHESKLVSLSEELLQLSKDLSQQLHAIGLSEDIDIARLGLLPTQDRKRTEETVTSIDREINISEHGLADQRQRLEQHNAQRRSESSKDEVVQQLNELNEQLRALNEHVGSLKKELEANAESKAKLSGLQEQIEVQHRQVLRWKALSNLMGSANGDAFARFAQTISLDQLLRFANDHLRRLSDRYQLSSDVLKPEELKLLVVDRHQAGWSRDTRTLSGGESFLVSLGLALGLAEMASQNSRIDSLFIDEGFGSLDEAALDDAISTLENLQSRGKTIGVISHVELLKERIQTQVKVTKLGNGYSEVAVTLG